MKDGSQQSKVYERRDCDDAIEKDGIPDESAVAASESQRGDKNAEIRAGKQETGSHEPDGRKGS
jgi:hypothetical protein